MNLLDRRVLEFEETYGHLPTGEKDELIRWEFDGMSDTRYYQILWRLQSQ